MLVTLTAPVIEDVHAVECSTPNLELNAQLWLGLIHFVPAKLHCYNFSDIEFHNVNHFSFIPRITNSFDTN
jgi:hypothetical protein